jgi:hypothetical protein
MRALEILTLLRIPEDNVYPKVILLILMKDPSSTAHDCGWKALALAATRGIHKVAFLFNTDKESGDAPIIAPFRTC